MTCVTTRRPACCVGEQPTRDWVTKTYTDGLAAFYPPCQHEECYPDDTPNIGDDVVRSAREVGATVVHRAVEADKPEQPEQPDKTGELAQPDKPEKPDKPEQPEQPERCVTTADGLERGDLVKLPDLTRVLEIRTVSTGRLEVVGPEGGCYTIEENHTLRPEPFRVSPAVGYVDELAVF